MQGSGGEMGTVCRQVTQVHDVGELELHLTVEVKHVKWEARKAHLVT